MAVSSIKKVTGSGVTLATSTNNQVATVTGANALTGESNLTFDGTDLAIGNAAPSSYIDSVHGLIVGDTGDATSEIVVATSTSGVAEINFTDTADTTNQGQIAYDHTGEYMTFDAGGGERMRIESSGHVNIGSGAGNSDYQLDVSSPNGNYVCGLVATSGAQPINILQIKFSGSTPDNNSVRFFTGSDETGNRIIAYSDGDVANHDNSYGGLSDERLKQDIVDASSQWDDIKNLRVRKYKFISDVEAHGDNAVAHLGVIAQEAELVSPGLVQHHVSDAVLDDEGNEVQPAVDEYSVQYSVLYMKCVKALQEAMARIETLEAQVAALQGA